jgi:NAD(P)H-quinone oxidoreductase subunit 4L
LYFAVAAVLVMAYALNLVPHLGVPADLADVFVTVLLLVLGLAAVFAGADKPFVLVAGTLGGFVCLTLAQEMVIRYMTLSALLFCLGMYGMVASRNAVRVLISIELMLNAVNINLVTFSRFIDPSLLRGQIFAIFILTVAAAEAAVGLAIVLAIYRNMSTVDMEKFNLLKW